MEQENNILNELNELGSSLGALRHVNAYSIPEGYFDSLLAEVLQRVRAMDAATPAAELGHLASVLPGIKKQMPYSVPANYFETLPQRMLEKALLHSDDQSASDELNELSPLLSGLKKQMPFTVPDGYFDSLSKTPVEVSKPAAKVVGLTGRKWFRYAAAAVVTGIIAMTGFMYFNAKQSADPGSKVIAHVSKDLKKMNDEQLNSLVDFFDAGLDGKETAQATPDTKSQEVKDLLKGISDKELKDFDEQSDDIEDVMTN